MRISVSGVDNIDTSLPASSECSNVSPDASGTRDCIIHRQEMDASNVGNVHVRAGDESGSWTGTGMAVSLTGEGNAMPFPSSTSLSLSRDLTGVHSSHQLDSGDVVDSTAECLHLSLEELRHHRMSFGKRIWSSVDPYKEEVEGQVWKKVRTVSFLPGSPTDLVSGSQADTADDDISEVEDDGADMDDELERDGDDGEADEHQDEHEHEHDYAMDVSSSLPSPTVIADGQTERWRERQEKAMMLAVKLAALASTSASTSTSTSCPQQSGASKDVSEESCVDDGSVCQRIVSQEDGHGQEQGRVQSLDSLKVGKTMGTTKVGVERKRRRSKTEMHGNSHASIAHAINIKSSTSTSTSTSSSTGGNSSKSTTESQPLSPSSAQSGTSNLSKGQKGKKDLPSKPDFRETKYLLSKYVRLWTTFLFPIP